MLIGINIISSDFFINNYFAFENLKLVQKKLIAKVNFSILAVLESHAS